MSAHRRPRALIIDAVFFTWLAYVVVSGNVLPDAVVMLFRHEQPAAISGPDTSPGQTPSLEVGGPPEA